MAETKVATPVLPQGASLTDATVIELAALRADTARYEWFQFKPGVKKLILSGTPDSRHVSVLWYGYEGQPGVVPLHYHEKTESIFVIDGAQSDPKGAYGKGSFYFNPPGSGHNIFDSSGLFLLSYAAPPDFKRTAEIGPYEPLVFGADYGKLPLAPCSDGSACYALPLSADGGMSGSYVKPAAPVMLTANVLLVLEGSCTIGGQAVAADTLVVTKATEPATYQVASAKDCLLFQLAFK
jgi:ChrR Cupin-like domain